MSIFNPPNSSDDERIKGVPVANMRYERIAPVGRQVGANLDFSGSKLTYRIEVSGITSLLMDRSDFRIRGTLSTDIAGIVALLSANQIAPAMGMPACLFKEERFIINNETVESHDKYIPQRYAYKCRVSKSGHWLNTAGEITYWDAQFNKRLAKVCSDLTLVEYQTGDVTSTIATRVTMGYDPLTTIAIQAGANGVRQVDWNLGVAVNPDTQWVVGDYLQVGDLIYRVAFVPAGAVTNMFVEDDGGAGIGAAVVDFWRFRNTNNLVAGEFKQPTIGFEISYKPALSIFDYEYILPTATYEFEMTPDINYRQYAIESRGGATKVHSVLPATANDYTFVIQEMYFMACMVDGEEIMDSQIIIDLSDVDVYSEVIPNSSTFERRFPLKKSTSGVSFAIQDDRVNTDTRYSHTRFITHPTTAPDPVTVGEFEKQIQTYEIEYAGQRQPYYRVDTVYNDTDAGANRQVNRYWEVYKKNLVYNGQYLGMAGVETFEEYMTRGPYFRMPFLKSGTNETTDAEVRVEFNTVPYRARMFVFNHYNKYAKITLVDGAIADVKVVTE